MTTYGIDIYSGDAQLDVFGVTLHDELLPALPTLNFSCATLLTGTIGAVIRERGIKQYQFTIATVSVSGGIYQYTCKAAESYALTTAIMALQTAYGATSDAIKLLVPSLNIVNASLLSQNTYPQLYQNIQPLDVIKQLLIQAIQPTKTGGAQASVRNGNLYVFPLDVSGQTPDYHMRRLDPLTVWQRDSDIYDAVQAHYVVKQYPSPDTALTLGDASNWTGTVTDVTGVDTTLLPVPSGALGMLKSVGNASRTGLSALFKNFDRVQFNWLPVTATTVLVSLQQDAGNKLELTHTFAGQTGAGFLLAGSPGVSTDVLTKNITLSPVQYVKAITGTVTASCSYTISLLNADDTVIWTDVKRTTIGNTFEAGIEMATVLAEAQSGLVATVRIKFTDLYLVTGVDYGVQCVQCNIQVMTYQQVGTHQGIISTIVYPKSWVNIGQAGGYPAGYNMYIYPQINLADLPGEQWYTFYGSIANISTGEVITWIDNSGGISGYKSLAAYVVKVGPVAPTPDLTITVVVNGTIADYAWVTPYFMWNAGFNLFEAVNLPLGDFERTGNPTNLATIAFTFDGDNYVDTLVLVADNPLPVTVRAGTGSRAYVVTDDFGSEAGAQAYADGLLPVVSVAREQYTRDVPLSTDLSVGDTINGDGVNMTIYAIDYRPEGKTIAAGKSMDTLMTRLAEQARRLNGLERKA